MTALIDLESELTAGVEQTPNSAFGAVGGTQTQALDQAVRGKDNRKRSPKLVALIRRAWQACNDGDNIKAAKLALKALDIDPEDDLANQLMAVVLEHLGRISKALEFYQRALKSNPNNPDLYNNLGHIAWRMNMLDAAEKFFRIHMDLAPDRNSSVINLAGILREKHRFEDAIELLRAAIYQNSEDHALWNALGSTLLEYGDPDQAITFYSEALRLKPDFSRGHHNMGYALDLVGDVQESIDHFKEALKGPQSVEDKATMMHGLAFSTLASGDLVEGWKQYSVRLSTDLPRSTIYKLKCPIWDGEDISDIHGKTVMVMGEQGLGDEVMFAQMIPDIIKAVGPEGEVRIAVEHRLVDLFQKSFPETRVIRHHTINREGRDIRYVHELDEDADFWFPVANAARTLRSRLSDFEVPAYLKPDPDKVEAYREQLRGFGSGMKIGLLWKSLKMDARRSKYFAGFEAWKPVLTLPGIDFVNLQYGDVEEEIKRAKRDYDITIHQPEGINLKDDLEDVAALGKACDLVIGPMNATLNLTAASGGKIWCIHAQKTNWVVLGAKTLPWYPTSRSFFSDRFGNWNKILKDVAGALKETQVKAA